MKLAIIGAGMIVKDFLSIKSHIKDLDLDSIFGRESNRGNMEELKREYGIKNIYYDYQEVLSSEADTLYIALPNNLHFEFARKALYANKNIIIEKPITTNYKEAVELANLAKEKKLFIFEAITNQYLPNYRKIKELVKKLGNIKIVQCNYSQYSSRYNSFKEGKVLPAFDPKFSGGALMDLNIYNIHYVVGLFGKPKNVEYYPNIEKGIDTSGVLILEYETFKCVCIGAKDCRAPIANNIQGDKGCIYQDTPANVCEGFQLMMNDGTESLINENNYDHRMVNEFIEFVDMVKNNDFKSCYKMLEHSLTVSEVQTIARNKSGIVFPEDNK
ncbi:Gfo/Idh/MocA family protein [Clostridium felsineum]|uniref:Scyllo-inositol 2-dehydrogenase (NADP(+)) IolU n=1 Tax=Clostridium felsineum TaxID=36839 RepID=A0A1S8LI99_9CLOT|nr:Gfo/Idh/MocA family oxidoreductase [Clostridium felsineum]URZ05502.1 scyllo-inositol 2-dehydrogenase (NADP(+)) IolU [Clostridium felsineum]URZ10541.1 scyllo-inositol 2-dehydrogenase (NADP(+)) IolU [Clostridium felsineum]